MTTEQAKQWVEWYFAHWDEVHEEYSDELQDTVIHLLCGCFDPTSPALREEYHGVETYHDLWLDIVTDEILESGLPSEEEFRRCYMVYGKDQLARGGSAPSKDGFRAWLPAWIGDEAESIMQHWPPVPKR